MQIAYLLRPVLKRICGRIGIGSHINGVQKAFHNLFDMETIFQSDSHQFDRLFTDIAIRHIGHFK